MHDLGHTPRALPPCAGALIMLATIADVFLTVLHARIGTGVFSRLTAPGTWRAFKALGPLFGEHRDKFLSFAGPVILGLLFAVWAGLLTLGAALCLYPNLGGSIRASGGETSTDFITALFAGGSSMSIVGTSNHTAHSPLAKLFYLFTSATGIAVASLTLTYLMQVYNALQRRHVLALRFDRASGSTGDAAHLLARLAPRDHFEGAYTILAELAGGLTAAKEALHFYPVLVCFRAPKPEHATPRVTLIALDTATLIETALGGEHAWFKAAAPALELQESGTVLLKIIEGTSLRGGVPDPRPPDAATERRWRARYAAAIDRLRDAGITTVEDPAAGADEYVRLRARWDHLPTAFAEFMAYPPDAVDPACFPPSEDGSDAQKRTTGPHGRPAHA